KEADEFAARMLLTEADRNKIFAYSKFTEETVLRLSEELNKHPSIIVSQVQRFYQHLYKSKKLNSLKVRVEFDELELKISPCSLIASSVPFFTMDLDWTMQFNKD